MLLAVSEMQDRMIEVPLGRAALHFPCGFTSETYATGHPIVEATQPACHVSQRAETSSTGRAEGSPPA